MRWPGLNLYPPLASHAGPLKSRPLVCVCFGPQCKICTSWLLCVSPHPVWTARLQGKGIDYQKMCANF